MCAVIVDARESKCRRTRRVRLFRRRNGCAPATMSLGDQQQREPDQGYGERNEHREH